MLVSVPYFIIAENFIYDHMIRLLKFQNLHGCTSACLVNITTLCCIFFGTEICSVFHKHNQLF